MDRHWALREVQLAFDENDCLLFPPFESKLIMLSQGPTYWSRASRALEGRSWSFWACRRPFAWNYNWYCLLKLLDDTWASINPWGRWNRVACIEEPHTVHGRRHTAGCRCIHEQSQCYRPHHVLGSPLARSAIWREWERRHWEESNASERWQR